MAKNPIERTLDKIGNVVQEVFNGTPEPPVINANKTTGQTCLEKMGITLRAQHLRQNMWRRNDIEYSKPLVLAEYAIQSEFKVSTTDETLEESKQRQEEKAVKTAQKQEKKRKKREEKEAKKQEQVKGVNDKKTEPQETILPVEAQIAQAMNYYTSPKTVNSYEDFFNAYDKQNGRFAPRQ